MEKEKINTGVLTSNVNLLLQKFTVTIDKLSSEQVQSQLEDEYRDKLSPQTLSSSKAALEDSRFAFRKDHEKLQTIEDSVKEEKGSDLQELKIKTEEQIAEVESRCDLQVAQLKEQIAKCKSDASEKIAQLKEQLKMQSTSIEERLNEKLKPHQQKASASLESLFLAYEDALAKYIEAEGNFMANCNEKGKRGLVKEVFPSVSRRKDS